MSVKFDPLRSRTSPVDKGQPPTQATKGKPAAKPQDTSAHDRFSRGSGGESAFDLETPRPLTEHEAKTMMASLTHQIASLPGAFASAPEAAAHAAKTAAFLIASRPETKAQVLAQTLVLAAAMDTIVQWPGVSASALADARQTALSQFGRLLAALKPDSAEVAHDHSTRVAAFQTALGQAKHDDAFRVEVINRARVSLAPHFRALVTSDEAPSDAPGSDGSHRHELASLIAAEQSRLIGAGASAPLIAIFAHLQDAAAGNDTQHAADACIALLTPPPAELSPEEHAAVQALLMDTLPLLRERGPDASDAYYALAHQVGERLSHGLSELKALSGETREAFEAEHGPVARTEQHLHALILELDQPFTSREQLFALAAAHRDLAPQAFAAIGFEHLTAFPVGEHDTHGWSAAERKLYEEAKAFETNERYKSYAITGALIVGGGLLTLGTGGTAPLIAAAVGGVMTAGSLGYDGYHVYKAQTDLANARGAASVHAATATEVSEAEAARNDALVDITIDVLLAGFGAVAKRTLKAGAQAAKAGAAAAKPALVPLRLAATHAVRPLAMGFLGAGAGGVKAFMDRTLDHSDEVAVVLSGAWTGFKAGAVAGASAELMHVVSTKAALRFGGRAIVIEPGPEPKVRQARVAPTKANSAVIHIDERPVAVKEVVTIVAERKPAAATGFDKHSAEHAPAGAKPVKIQLVVQGLQLEPPKPKRSRL